MSYIWITNSWKAPWLLRVHKSTKLQKGCSLTAECHWEWTPSREAKACLCRYHYLIKLRPPAPWYQACTPKADCTCEKHPCVRVQNNHHPTQNPAAHGGFNTHRVIHLDIIGSGDRHSFSECVWTCHPTASTNADKSLLIVSQLFATLEPQRGSILPSSQVVTRWAAIQMA